MCTISKTTVPSRPLHSRQHPSQRSLSHPIGPVLASAYSCSRSLAGRSGTPRLGSLAATNREPNSRSGTRMRLSAAPAGEPDSKARTVAIPEARVGPATGSKGIVRLRAAARLRLGDRGSRGVRRVFTLTGGDAPPRWRPARLPGMAGNGTTASRRPRGYARYDEASPALRRSTAVVVSCDWRAGQRASARPGRSGWQSRG